MLQKHHVLIKLITNVKMLFYMIKYICFEYVEGHCLESHEMILLITINSPIQLLFQEKNPGIKYEYTIKKTKETGNEVIEPLYSWRHGAWTDCSTTCGIGSCCILHKKHILYTGASSVCLTLMKAQGISIYEVYLK